MKKSVKDMSLILDSFDSHKFAWKKICLLIDVLVPHKKTSCRESLEIMCYVNVYIYTYTHTYHISYLFNQGG